jgi:hypothetical protein
LVQRLGREIGNEHFLPAICTNNLAELSGMNFARNDVVMGHVRSITFMKNELENGAIKVLYRKRVALHCSDKDLRLRTAATLS